MNADDAFDTRLREAHAASLAHLSPRVRAQLALRRRGTASPAPASRARPALGLAFATLAVCALAVGLFRPGAHDAGDPRLARQGPATVSAADTLDDNPDFYLWLASRDADALASE